jgi:NADH-quinone oxidoreductase subunit H
VLAVVFCVAVLAELSVAIAGSGLKALDTHGPGPEALGPLWMLLKILLGAFFFIWVRSSMPRLRYDQLMSFGWKVLLPLATLNVLVTAIVLVST